MSFRYDVLLLLHCYSTVKPKNYICFCDDFTKDIDYTVFPQLIPHS